MKRTTVVYIVVIFTIFKVTTYFEFNQRDPKVGIQYIGEDSHITFEVTTPTLQYAQFWGMIGLSVLWGILCFRYNLGVFIFRKDFWFFTKGD